MKETKYVAFSTQKGGAGKTTLTVLVASYLHYVKRYDVAVIDCDFPSTVSMTCASATWTGFQRTITTRCRLSS